MDDTARLGNALPRLLRELRYAKREANRYTDFTANAGNFVMRNESTAGSSDDCGYRMLFLFRFWNVIEYFSPNRNLTDTPWGEIPEKYIPLFIPGQTPGNPNQAMLLRELCDSHSASVRYNMFGYNTVPAEVRNADDRVFVIADGPLRKLMLLGEDEIKVSQYGQWIQIDGIRRGVARVEYRLDSYIQMSKHD